MSNEKEKKELLGVIGVDSGQIIICDPCYLKKWKDNEYSRKLEDGDFFSYNAACHATKKNGGGCIGTFPGHAVVLQTGYGDGLYDVEVLKKDGRIKEVKIKFF